MESAIGARRVSRFLLVVLSRLDSRGAMPVVARCRAQVCRRRRRTSVEGGDEVGGPGPGGGEAESGASSGAGDLAGGVEQAVAQPFGFGPGEVAVEADQPASRPAGRGR